MPTHFLLFKPIRVKAVACCCHGRSALLQAKCCDYFFMAVVVMQHATAMTLLATLREHQ
jgi:hypothetical protein